MILSAQQLGESRYGALYGARLSTDMYTYTRKLHDIQGYYAIIGLSFSNRVSTDFVWPI